MSEASQSPRDIRVGDTEREAALKALGEHLSAGRIDIDEYGDRSARVTAARTRGDLRGLFTDLPEPHPVLGDEPAPLAGAVPATTGRPTTAVDRPSGAGQAARATAGALTSVAWVAAIAAMVFVHGAWPVIFIPIALSAVFGSIWGRHWNRNQDWREDRERYRRERRGER